MDLGEDWSNNEIIQAAAIGEFTSLDGIEWRSGAETASDEVKFDDALWKRIFSETSQFLKDSHFGKEDINIDVDTGIQMFVEGKSAMFHDAQLDDGHDYFLYRRTALCGADGLRLTKNQATPVAR